jgi:hypothetical protein
MMTASFEHSAKVEATAGESSAVPFEERYFEAMVQALVAGEKWDEEQFTKAVQEDRICETVLRKRMMWNVNYLKCRGKVCWIDLNLKLRSILNI